MQALFEQVSVCASDCGLRRLTESACPRQRSDPKAPLFQAVDITKSRLKGNQMNRQIVFRMVRRRARRAGLPPSINCHSFRATGITNYLSNGGALEDARAIAAHESSQTTQLYDRTVDRITLDEIERIRF